MPAFDTLQVAKELGTAITPEQAEALVKAFAHTLADELATERDLRDVERALREDIQRLDARVAAVETRLGAVETRLEAFETKLEVQVASLRSEIRSTATDLKAEMIKWIVGAIAFNLLGTAGLMITLIKMIPH